MDEWKNEILEVLEEKAKEQGKTKFYDAAFEMGYTDVKAQDVEEIAGEFIKRNPSYKAVRDAKDGEKESLFTTLILTQRDDQEEGEVIETIGR